MFNYKPCLFAFIFVVSTSATFFAPKNAQASGIPVVDIASITQQITQYVQNLTDYSNQIQQLVTQGQSYTQLLTQYSQQLQEYNHYLNQVKSIRSSISAADWNNIARQTVGFYGLGNLSIIASMDPASSTFIDDLNLLLGSYGHIPRLSSDVVTDLTTLGVSSADAALIGGSYEQLNKQFERYQELQRVVSSNQVGSVGRQGKIQDLGMRLRNLSDESDLQTSQLIATQQQLQMDQSEASLNVLNQILQQQGLEAAATASKKAEIMDKEIIRLQSLSPGAAPMLGRDSWGSF